MQKIGFSLQSSYTLPIPDVLKLLQNIGFYAVSPVWQKDGNLAEIVRAAQNCNLCLQTLHGPFRGLPSLWEAHSSPALLQDLLCAVDDCAAYEIPTLVVHSWGGIDYTFREDALCFDCFDRLIEHAQRRNIQIAFENLEGPEYLDALMDHYVDCDTVGFCWDSGHELCYTPSRDFLKVYGSRLLATHLNDNFGVTHPDGQLQGTDDLHLLPGDGIANWPQTVCRLQQARRQEILNFELKIRPKGDRCKTDLYSKIPLEQYLTQAYIRACTAVSDYFE